jgi:hypothetical protein
VAKQNVPKDGPRGPYSGQPIHLAAATGAGAPTGLLRWDAGGPQAAFAGSNRSEEIRDDGGRMCGISRVTLTIQLCPGKTQ